jgi:hypothetical protein
MRKSAQPGKNTLSCEVLGATPFGLWILLQNEEFYLNYHDFPWFKTSTLESIMNVKALSAEHLYWPDLDIDLHLDSVKNPKNYPLVAKARKKSSSKSAAKKKKVA